VVEADRGREREEAGADAGSEPVEGAGAVAFEAEKVFAGLEDRLDPLPDRRQVRPLAGFVFAAGPADGCVQLGRGVFELAAGVARQAVRPTRPPGRQTRLRSCRLRRQGAGSPFQWGDEAYVEAMLGGAFELSFEELDTRHEGEHGGEMWEVFRDNYGPSFTLRSSLDGERRAELDAAMVACFERHRSGDGVSMERRYIVVTGIRKAG
jgi:hypothetical protein